MASASNEPDAVIRGREATDGEKHDTAANEHTYGRWHKYVKPRVGQMFQVDKKILRSRSVQSLEETDSERSSAGASVAAAETAQSPFGRRGRPTRGREAAVRLNETLGVKAAHQVAAAASQRIVPERGGLCVHRPPTDGISSEKDEFLEFSRNIIMQTPAWNSPAAFSSLERRWKDEIADKFGGPAFRRSGSNISTSSGRKRGRKRKVAESDDDVSRNTASFSEKEDDESSKLSGMEVMPSTDALSPVELSVDEKPERKAMQCLEEDELMLSYLQSKHKGNCDVAKFSMLSDLSMGRAVQARRHLKKRRKEEEMEAPLSDMLYPSESWRRRYERLCSAMRGDVKNRPGLAKYSFITGDGIGECTNGNGAVGSQKNLSTKAHIDNQILSSGEELKKVWRSVLECAEDIVDRTNGSATGRGKPTLRDLLTLLGKAHTLMRPEEIFGKRDTSVKRISQCMNLIVDRAVMARNSLAKLVDIVYDEKDEGIELDVLEKYIENIEVNSPLIVEETETLRTMVNEASQWERRLDHVLRPDHSDSSSLSESFDRNNILGAVEQLASDAQVLSLRPRSLVLLEIRIEKARVLRNRIREMKQSENREGSENKKLIAALVRESNKLDLAFPELTMLTEVHEAAQEWTDRAAVAARSRISLAELEELVERGDTMPVNLSDLLEKLRSRVAQANSWITCLREKLGIMEDDDGGGDDGKTKRKMDETKWLGTIRSVLCRDDDRAAGLHDLAVEGSRIPVDIPELHLLQVEIDARNWSMKARKLLERKGKIDDLREHLIRGDAIRDKVPLDPDKKTAWILGSEKDLLGVVESSDAWYRKYRPYLEGDNRRADGRCRISITLLRQIVAEGNSINANLGNASVKMNRILSQAEIWVNEHNELLAGFKISVAKDSQPAPNVTLKDSPVKMDAVNVALERASELSVDLEEAMQLKALAEKSQKWFSRALAIAPKRSKRNARGKKKVNREKNSLDELLSLVQEASELPIDISEDLERLQMQLTEVQSWRLQAQCELRSIAAAFGKLQNERLCYYGAPEAHMDNLPEKQKGTVLDCGDSSSLSPPRTPKASEGLKVHRMIGSLVKSVQSIGIYTAEEGIAEVLGKVSKWCTKAAVLIATPAQIFEKRYFKDLDSLVAEGEALLEEDKSEGGGAEQLDDATLMTELRTSWSRLVADDKIRLEKCRARRDEFISWCETTEAILSATDKKIPIETLRDLGNQSLIYPKGADTVKRVQTLLQEANAWIEATNAVVKSGQKISLEDAKDRVAKGEKLNISCQEFRNLRNALRVARGWQLRVKRSKLDSGQSQISDIKDLIAEHNSFLVCMPDEMKKLKEALQGYCLCRKPYEGFMVGCDTCEEWFHGPCIGVSESQAERYDKYVCVRCVISKLYKGCAETTVQAIRKWTNSKDLTKARQIDGQRHQRKVREKRREIEKLKTEIEALKLELDEEGGDAAATAHDAMGKDQYLQSSGCATEAVNTGASTHQQERPHDSLQPLNGEQSLTGAVQASNLKPGADNGFSKDGVVQNSGFSDATLLSGTVREEESASQESSPKNTDEKREKLSKALATLDNCQRRMDQLAEILNERKARESREDTVSASLRRWFIMVRSMVLVPNTSDQAKTSRPRNDGSLSPPMDQAVIEATKLGIRHLPDVSLAINAFGCMAWSLRALHVLSRKPKIEEIRTLVSQSEGASFKLPETKCVRMLQSPLSRATLWQAKVAKALKPMPGEKKPYEVELLSGLLQSARDIPYTMPEESQLWNTIEDEGNRHCLCGGPSDGSFMISCDKCETWYHGDCVKLDKTQGDAQSKWMCPLCTGAVTQKTWQLQARSDTAREMKKVVSDAKDTDHVFEEDVSQCAPDVNGLWPPFGLVQSAEALTALGVSDPSECEDFDASILIATACASDSPAAQPPKQLQRIEPPAAILDESTTAKSTPSSQQAKQLKAGTVVGNRTTQPLLVEQRVTQGRERHARVAGAPGNNGSSELSKAVQLAIKGTERLPQPAETARSVSVQQTSHSQMMVQGRERLPQSVEARGNGPAHLQLMLGRGRLPQSLSAPREDSVQVTQAMQLMAQSLKSPAGEAGQASQAMQLLAQGGGNLRKPREIHSLAPHSMQATMHGREGLSQQAMAARAAGAGYQTQPIQAIQGIERLPQQVGTGSVRTAVRASSAIQRVQGVPPRESFFPQNPSVAVSSAAVEVPNEKRNGLAAASIHNAHHPLPHQPASNSLSIQQSVPVTNIPANGPAPRQEHVSGLYAPSAASIPSVARQGPEAQNQLMSTAAIVSRMNYSIEKR